MVQSENDTGGLRFLTEESIEVQYHLHDLVSWWSQACLNAIISLSNHTCLGANIHSLKTGA